VTTAALSWPVGESAGCHGLDGLPARFAQRKGEAHGQGQDSEEMPFLLRPRQQFQSGNLVLLATRGRDARDQTNCYRAAERPAEATAANAASGEADAMSHTTTTETPTMPRTKPAVTSRVDVGDDILDAHIPYPVIAIERLEYLTGNLVVIHAGETVQVLDSKELADGVYVNVRTEAGECAKLPAKYFTLPKEVAKP
jgi:hypothetical protein